MPVRDRNRIYVDTTKNPNEGVAVADVQMLCPVTIKRTVNGVVERRNSCDVGVLCSGKVGDIVPDNEGGQSWVISSRIPVNKWAKYKPIEPVGQLRGKLDPLTEQQRQAVNWGISNIPIWTNKTIENVVNCWVKDQYNANNHPDGHDKYPDGGWWCYTPPSSAFRLSDFVSKEDPDNKGYFKGSQAPIGPYKVVDYDTTGLVTIQFVSAYEGVTAGLSLTFTDFQVTASLPFDRLYFGVVIYVKDNRNQEHIYLATQDNPVGDLDATYQNLWSKGVSVGFKAHPDDSGALGQCLLNGGMFTMFPVITSLKNYVGATYIHELTNATTPRNNENATFVTIHRMEEIESAMPIIEATILKFRAYKGGTTLQTYMTIESELKCNVPDIGITVRATYKIYKTSLRDELVFTKTVIVYIDKNESKPGSVPFAQSDIQNYTVTGNELIDIEVEVIDHPFSRKTDAICGVEMNGSAGTSGGHPIPSWEQYVVTT